jgi:hypothetical protein
MSSAPRKNFQERVCEAIISGDLASFTSLSFSPGEIDRRLLPHLDLSYRPRTYPSERYIRPRGPTSTILAILCEQVEILAYILDRLSPDLTIRVEGQSALHIAALVKDFRPLQLLLRCPSVREDVDSPVDLAGVSPPDGFFTTALHTAVSHRRLRNALLLLSPGGAAVDRRSATGATPLELAAASRDARLVEALLAAGADVALRNARGEAPAELATRLQAAGGGRRAAAVCAVLAGPPSPRLDAFRAKYAPELVPAEDTELKRVLDAIAELTERIVRLEGPRVDAT